MPKLISKKKRIYPPTAALDGYLKDFNRSYPMPISYQDLLGYSDALALYDKHGEDTLWSTLHYPPGLRDEISHGLLTMYAYMRTEDDHSSLGHLKVDRVDLCMYGNTKPFRIRITNRLNDNSEYYYIKQADANRIFGLELEHILSPNRITYFSDSNTLLEDHIYGIPGDMFRDRFMENPNFNKVRFAKEFVKFNERCLLTLLGDMHASNFVVHITMDFEMNFYRIRAIDFDQQSHEGRLKVYRPQFFPQNYDFVKLVMDTLSEKAIHQYQKEERTLIYKRMRSSRYRFRELLKAMSLQNIAHGDHVISLRQELAAHHKDNRFLSCSTMSELLAASLETLVKK